MSIVPIACVMLFTSVACFRKRTASNVHVVVPNGFRGVFEVIEATNGNYVNVDNQGRYVITVPDTAMVLVHDTSFLVLIANLTATYADGQSLAVTTIRLKSTKADSISLHLVTVDSNSTYYLLVGTDQQLDELSHSRDFQLGTVQSESAPTTLPMN